MRDLDRLLSDTLRSVGETYRPADEREARAAFLRRSRRRRWFLLAGIPASASALAVIAALLFASPSPEPSRPSEPELRVASAPLTISDRVVVGDGPSGMVVGDEGIWVAVARKGAVTLVDPASQRVTQSLPIDGHPDDVAITDDDVWVSNPSEGVVHQLERTAEIGAAVSAARTDHEVKSEAHQDIASGFGSIWLAVKGEATYRWALADEELVPVAALDSPADVAVGEGWVWFLGEDEGTPALARVNEKGEARERFILPIEDVMGDADLAAGEGWIWIALGDEGRVLRVSPSTGEVSGEAEVGGDFAGISVGAGVIWVLVGDEDGSGGRVVRIEPDSLEPVEDSLELARTPADIVVVGNTAWISIADGNHLKRVQPTAP
jgi:hypothetical protein